MSLHRRTFIKAAAGAAVAGHFAAPLVRAVSPNGKLNHADIGVGGMGWNDFNNFLAHPKVNIAAICDVDSERLAKAAEKAPDAKRYEDWRELLEKEGDRIDSANVTVPDHMHAPIVLNLLRRGKHVYCQKPMCHDVSEVRTLTKAAKQAGVRTQLGTQAASTVGSRMAVGFVQDGVIGKIKRVVLRSNRPGAIDTYRLVGPRPENTVPAPKNLNWNLWIGTAPERPYAPEIYHPAKWRAWQDFGTGWSGDIGCHLFHAVWRALELKAPTAVSARVQESWQNDPRRRGDTWPQSDHVIWSFAGNQYTAGDFEIDWYDGLFEPPQELNDLLEGQPYHTESALFLGTEGTLLLPNGGGPQLFPQEKYKSIDRPQLPGRHHYHDFADACFSGETTESDFSFSGPMSETVLLGTVAIRVPDTKLAWNPESMSFTNSPEANKLLKRDYRDGWQVKGL